MWCHVDSRSRERLPWPSFIFTPSASASFLTSKPENLRNGRKFQVSSSADCETKGSMEGGAAICSSRAAPLIGSSAHRGRGGRIERSASFSPLLLQVRSMATQRPLPSAAKTISSRKVSSSPKSELFRWLHHCSDSAKMLGIQDCLFQLIFLLLRTSVCQIPHLTKQ